MIVKQPKTSRRAAQPLVRRNGPASGQRMPPAHESAANTYKQKSWAGHYSINYENVAGDIKSLNQKLASQKTASWRSPSRRSAVNAPGEKFCAASTALTLERRAPNNWIVGSWR
jgi:hypothetical protein